VSNPAKDEADLVQCMAKAMHDSVYGGESAWVDVSKIERSYREMEADAALAAIRAAGWAVVPVEPTEGMRRATWEAQLRHTNEKLHMELPDWRIQQALQARMDDPKQREMDRVAYAATLAAAPGVEP